MKHVYHDECPCLVDDFTLGQRGAVLIEDPEQRNHPRVGVDLTLQVNVRLADFARPRLARYPRSVCRQTIRFVKF